LALDAAEKAINDRFNNGRQELWKKGQCNSFGACIVDAVQDLRKICARDGSACFGKLQEQDLQLGGLLKLGLGLLGGIKAQ